MGLIYTAEDFLKSPDAWERRESLITGRVSQEQLEQIVPKVHTTRLQINFFTGNDLSALEQLTDLDVLEMRDCPNVTKLWDVSKNAVLRVLTMSDFPSLYDIDQLAGATSLQRLELAGGFPDGNTLNLKSLEPLRRLNQLDFLALSNLKIEDKSQLAPLGNLTNLRTLSLSDQFETEEYARLSVLLPNTECRLLQPYYELDVTHIYDGKDIWVNGKGKPRLNSQTDAARLEKYAQAFKDLQAKYQQG